MKNVVLSKAQRETIKKLVTCLIVTVVSLAVPTYLSGKLTDMEKRKTWLDNDINDLNRKLEGLNKKTLELADSIKIWESFSDEDKKLEGLRINDAKEILDKLQKKYLLNSVKTSFSKPDEIGNDYKTETVAVISSIVTTSFNAISDEYVYNFVYELSKKLPGYVQIKNLTITKPNTVTKETLKKISVGEDVTVVPVNLDFYWHDLKYKPPVATTPGQAGAPAVPGAPNP